MLILHYVQGENYSITLSMYWLNPALIRSLEEQTKLQRYHVMCILYVQKNVLHCICMGGKPLHHAVIHSFLQWVNPLWDSYIPHEYIFWCWNKKWDCSLLIWSGIMWWQICCWKIQYIMFYSQDLLTNKHFISFKRKSFIGRKRFSVAYMKHVWSFLLCF